MNVNEPVEAWRTSKKAVKIAGSKSLKFIPACSRKSSLNTKCRAKKAK